MATPAETSQAITNQPAPKSLQQVIEASAKELGRALPEHMNANRLVRIALTCIRTTPGMEKVTQESFLGALFTAAELGIEPIAGRAYLIPFKNNRKKPDGTWHKVSEAEFVLGYKGLVELFYRHKKAIELAWGIVREGDEFEYEYGTRAYLKHIPAKGEGRKSLGYWVMAHLEGGGKPFLYMSAEECLSHGRDHSKTWITKKWDDSKKRMVDCDPQWAADSPWLNEPDAMSLKTVLVQLCKVLPLSFELQKAIAADETSRDFKQGVTSAFDLPTNTDWHKEATALPETTDKKNEDASPTEAQGSPSISQVTGKPIEFGE